MAGARSGGRRVRRELGLAWLGYTSLGALLLWRAWTPRAVDRLLLGGPDGDFLRQFLPWRVFVARTWASGRMPLWNPHQDGGTPALADPQLAVLYPWRFVQVPFALGGRSLGLPSLIGEAIAHIGLAGALTFGLLRALGARPAAAALGGLAYALSGFLTGYPLDQLAVLDSAAWLPGILWGLAVATRTADPRRRRSAALGAGAATALSLLAGHPQTLSFGLLSGALWLLAEAADLGRARVRQDGRAFGPRRAGAVATWWWLSAAGLSAAQWWPSAEFLAAASRELTRTELLAGLPPRDWVQLFAPHAMSRWSPLYVGAPVLLLAAWGLVRAPATRFWLGLSGIGLLWSLGGNGPLVPLLLRVSPAMPPFRHQERAAVLVALGLAVAAGLAAERLAADERRRWREPAWLAAVAAVGLGLIGGIALRTGWVPTGADGPWAWADATTHGALHAALAATWMAMVAAGCRVSPRSVAALGGLALVLAHDLLAANAGHALGPWPEGGPFDRDARVEILRERAKDGRVSSEGRLPGGANAASLHGFYDATGDSPLHLSPVQRLIELAPELAWWRLLGVRYLVSDRELGAQEAALLSPLADDGGGAPLYEVGLPAPPVWTTPRAWCVDSFADWLPPADLDPLVAVVVTRSDFEARWVVGPDPLGLKRWLAPSAVSVIPDCAAPGDREAPRNEPMGSARLTGLDPGRALVEADLPSAAWVVWSNAWDPNGGWRVRVTSADGSLRRPVAFPAYGALTAVWLPAGAWTIEWTYRPLSVILGSLISLLGCALCVVVLRKERGR